MAVPKQHRSKSKVGKSRMHKFIKPVSLSVCPNCKKLFIPHRVCPNCGFYGKYKVIDVLEKLDRKEKKARKKEIEKIEKDNLKKQPLSVEELAKNN